MLPDDEVAFVDQVDAVVDDAVSEPAPVEQLAPRKRGRPRKHAYDPRLRQLSEGYRARSHRTAANSEGSWWVRPDADFTREADRMHGQGSSSVSNLIGWKGVGTSSQVGSGDVIRRR